MQEIEVKILEIDIPEIEDKLKSIGAEKVFKGELIAILWDFPDYRLKNSGRTLRLRSEAKKIKLTLKNRKQHKQMKVMEETEIGISDYKKMKTILKAIGLKNMMEMKKTRISYILNDVRFELDNYHGEHEFVPPLLEIETQSEEKLKEILYKLGFNMRKTVKYSATELINYYIKNKK